MKLKPGVSLMGVQPELVMGLMIANSVYAEYDVDMVVTSLLDGKHSQTSLHYVGCAADLRTRTVPVGSRTALKDALVTALPNDFDVVLETDHIHLEYQPRRRD